MTAAYLDVRGNTTTNELWKDVFSVRPAPSLVLSSERVCHGNARVTNIIRNLVLGLN
jgi:hypothetical protein